MKLRLRPLGQTGLHVSELGFGCASFWANRRFPEGAAIDLVQAAVEGGINHFDTGASYGCGRGEVRLGKAIREIPRERLILSSKAGTLCHGRHGTRKAFSPQALRDSLHASLERLQTDHLDILYLHGPGSSHLGEELTDTLQQLRHEGLAHHIGINSFDSELVLAASRHPLFEVFMIEYNILRQGNLALTAQLHRSGKGVVAGSALGRALYSRRRLDFSRPGNLWYLLRALVTSRGDLAASRRFRSLEGAEGL
ncbi:MAG TPA: aldo/keto reductase, partial [Sedimenticola sp.]|nr:aldo/keto reductase [Sedimenticola sp.]